MGDSLCWIVDVENAFYSNHGKLSKKIVKQSSVTKKKFRVMCSFSIYTNVNDLATDL